MIVSNYNTSNIELLKRISNLGSVSVFFSFFILNKSFLWETLLLSCDDTVTALSAGAFTICAAINKEKHLCRLHRNKTDKPQKG